MKISRLRFRARLLLLPKQSHPLAISARRGLTEQFWPRMVGWCEKFVRYAKTDAYGSQFSHLQRSTALETALVFQDAGYSVPVKNGSIEGDLLYKLTGSGGAGHVGIRLRGNMVAENSTVHWDGTDARGIRTLAEFGNYDLIIRLPSSLKGSE